MERRIIRRVKGRPTSDGAGVKLVRVLGPETVEDFDPILMLDSFDSKNPEDYQAGFPDHPHRGIETISYLASGAMTHRDSLGNEDTIRDGEVQWMTAGSGIIHSENLPASERLLGVQLWLNLPAKAKMTKPAYQAIRSREIPEIELEGGRLRLLAGRYRDVSAYLSDHLPLNYWEVQLDAGASVKLDIEPGRSLMAFSLDGEVRIAGEILEEKTAVVFSDGDFFTIESVEPARILVISSRKLDEPVAWGGPIVMNTREELEDAMRDLRAGTFIKEEPSY